MKNRKKLKIPSELDFSDLQLRRLNTGQIGFKLPVLEQIVEVNHSPEALMNDRAWWSLVTGWYEIHRNSGGSPDPLMEQLVAGEWELLLQRKWRERSEQ